MVTGGGAVGGSAVAALAGLAAAKVSEATPIAAAALPRARRVRRPDEIACAVDVGGRERSVHEELDLPFCFVVRGAWMSPGSPDRSKKSSKTIVLLGNTPAQRPDGWLAAD